MASMCRLLSSQPAAKLRSKFRLEHGRVWGWVVPSSAGGAGGLGTSGKSQRNCLSEVP